ncbi:uncharacterized protein haspin isoform X2 [Lepisosteus oculatus]|uniref:uncharacterized protein haspin isoform X2 n=1 Tax=Lepisosteus oculatus TaxID=7918 RepID=UPI0035F505BC
MKKFTRQGPVVLKTYGKYSRTYVRNVEVWLSPDIRQAAFSSTSCSDLSINTDDNSNLKTERRKRQKPSTFGSKPTRKAKQAALLALKEDDDDKESVSFSSAVGNKANVKNRRGRCRNRDGVLNAKQNIPDEGEESIFSDGLKSEKVATAEFNNGVRKSSTASRAVHRISKRRAALTISLSSSSDSSSDTRQGCLAFKSGKENKMEESVKSDIFQRFVTSRRKRLSKKPDNRKEGQKKKKQNAFIPPNNSNSSEDFEDFVKPSPFGSYSKKKRRRRNEETENTSSEMASNASQYRKRTRNALKEVSFNSISDSVLKRCYKKPLLSSTPSVLPKPSSRPCEHTVSEISFSNEEMDGVLKSGAEVAGSVPSPRQREFVGMEDKSLELKTQSTNTSEGSIVCHGQTDQKCAKSNKWTTLAHSMELFSEVYGHSDNDSEKMKKSCSSIGCLSQQKSENSNFVSAKTHLGDVTSVKESVRNLNPIVLLDRIEVWQSQKKQTGVLYSSTEDLVHVIDGKLSDGCLSDNFKADENESDHISSNGSHLTKHTNKLQQLNVHGNLRMDSIFPSSNGMEVINQKTGNINGQIAPEKESKSRFQEVMRFSASVNVGAQNCDVPLQNADLTGDQCSKDASCLEEQFQKFGKPGKEVSAASQEEDSVHSEEGGAVSVNCRNNLLTIDRVACSRVSSVNMTAQAEKPKRHRKTSCQRRLLSNFSSDLTKTTSVSDSNASKVESACSPAGKIGGKTKTRGFPKEKPGTARKACISGFSVSRWTKKDQYKKQGQKKCSVQSVFSDSADNSLPDLGFGTFMQNSSMGNLKSWLHGTNAVLQQTPVGKGQIRRPSLLSFFSPETLTTNNWSRLKAALSVHKKQKAVMTPEKMICHNQDSLENVWQNKSNALEAFTTPRISKLRFKRDTGGSSLNDGNSMDEITDEEKVYQECQQEGPITFQQCIPPDKMKLCKKIGEGTFGEVFSTTNSKKETVALKIIPIAGHQKVNGEDQKTFAEILHEVIISKELSSLGEKENNQTEGFITLNNLHCVQGSYPEQLLKAWDKFDRERTSENDRPDFFGSDQLFLILEFEFGGSDLENMKGKLSSLVVAKSILHQVAAALAVAEEALHFEHRDLHWGNVLVKPTKEKEGKYTLNRTPGSFETSGVHVNIIDYSLSRLEIDGLTVSCDISSDEELFMGKGDYQFEIYRKMREENGNIWSDYNPHTNVLWLHYLSDKLLQMTYKRKATTNPLKKMKASLVQFHREVLQYQSATHVLQNCSLFQ